MPYELGERPRCQQCGGSLTHPDERCLCGGRSESWPEPQLRQDRAPEGSYGVVDCPMCEVPEARSMPPSLTWEQAFSQLMERYVVPDVPAE